MLFSKKTRAKLNLTLVFHSYHFTDGTADSSRKEIVIPTAEKVVEETIIKLKQFGFSVKRTDPKKANSIIRVFWQEDIHHGGKTYFFYGTDMYIKSFGKFCMSSAPFRLPISYETYKINLFFSPNEHELIPTHFVDYYVKIS